MRHVLYVGLLLLFTSFNSDELPLLKKYELDIDEPSGICYDAETKNYYVVSDKGAIYKLSKKFKIKAEKEVDKADLEAVCLVNNLLVAADESNQEILYFNKKNLNLIKKIKVEVTGDKKSGIEALTYIRELNQYVAIREKNPVELYYLTSQLKKTNTVPLKNFDDVSGVTYHNKHLYILSDQDEKIVKMDIDLNVVKSYDIDIKNPEGICFNEKNIIITSDKEEELYVLKAF